MKQSKQIRTVFSAILASSLMAGCTGSTASAGSQTGSASGDAQSSISETVTKGPTGSYTAVWYVEPSWKLDGVAELMPSSSNNNFGVYEEQTGYSQEWKYLLGNFSNSAVQDYETDAIKITSNGSEGIMNYEGYILYSPEESANQTITYSPPAGYVVNMNKDTLEGLVLTSNYMGANQTTKEQQFITGLDGNNQYVKDGVVCDANSNTASMFYNAKTRAVLNAGTAYKNFNGSALVGTDGNVITTYSYVLKSDYTFVNGYVEVTNGTGYGALDPSTGNLVTKTWYSDMKWFQEGYCPVAVDGKWGLIDQYGNDVLECVFDDVSAVVNGKAFVGINGIYGILDITETAALGITGNLDNCYPDGTPDPSTFKSSEFKFKGGICGGDTTTAEGGICGGDTTSSAITGAKGKVKVNVNGLRIRADHTTSSESLGNVENGGVYYYYDTYSDGTYTWYQIGEGQWIANTGEWLTVFGVDVFGTATVHVIDLIIRTDHSTSAPRNGYAEYEKTYDVYAFYQGSDYQWLKIGDNAWVANNGTWVTVVKY